MRYHPVMKTLAMIVSALMVVVLCFSFLSFWFLLEANLYSDNIDTLVGRLKDYRSESLAGNLIRRYAHEKLSNVPQGVLAEVMQSQDDEAFSYLANIEPGTWTYEIRDAMGNVLETTATDPQSNPTVFYNYTAAYFVLAETGTDYGIHHTYYGQDYSLKKTTTPPYQISIYVEDAAITAAYGMNIETIRSLYHIRYHILAVMAASALLCLGCLIYLCFAAGRRYEWDDIRAGGLNRIPLDLYIPAVVFACYWLCRAVYEMSPLDHMYQYAGNAVEEELLLKAIITAAFSFAGGLLGTALIFALAAQWKTPDRFWLKNTVLYRLLSWVFRQILKLFGMLPVMWQWLLVGLGMGGVILFCIAVQSEFLLAVTAIHCILIVIYGAWAYGTLLQGAKRMAEGDLQIKIPTRFLIGAFRDMAVQLNALADVTTAAANAQLRSDRMKTELITNVSHDIKTPLTSIINYTDLLRSAQTPEEQADYLAILDSQSQRLKKLIEDLTELSKASTGNLQANTAPMDALEALTQALGEFSDKLATAQLQVCTDLPGEPVMIQADGRLFWRVTANLLSNVVKYALPGTRVYISLKQVQPFAVISIKNISREPLNIGAEELMERFVRGDQSRNTEGSGLGLSIAASLMEVQKGRLDLEINGDLFAASLYFPLSGEEKHS